jgi:hypothetical protein
MVERSGAAHDDETGDDWVAADSRFEIYARRLWDGLLKTEELVDR